MAYRFNPPPNWPIDDPNWSPPPGWQPDSSWGPAPEGWNFWIEGDAPAAAESTAPEESAAPQEPDADDGTRLVPTDPQQPSDDDATRVGRTDEQGAMGAAAPVTAGGEDVTEGRADDSTHVADTDEQNEPAQSSGESATDGDVSEGTSSETAEYQGPDLEAGLAQQAPYEQAPYETVEPVQSDPYGGAGAEAPQPDAGYGAAAGAGAAGAAGYGAVSAGDQGYGQASPAPGYGQQSPAPGYGQGSASDYPAPPGYGQDSANGWTATTAPGEAPKKGVIARFWWVGCIVLFLVGALVIAVIGGILLFGGNDETAGGEGQTTTQEESADEEETTQEEEATEGAESPDPTTALPTIDPSAEAKDVIGENGAGTVAVHMAWVPAEELPSMYGGTVEPSPNGEYLVMTAEMTVTEGQMDFPSFYFEVMTPYGGAVEDATETYALADSGLDYDSSYEFTKGESYTITKLFAPKRAAGMTLQYDNYVDVYTWDVPA
ncbi:hypothetical protein [Brachybacterium sp. FME24]|uniref:hypothetical protein n=1 Tax=Brachybacterium sp. FME24 TaxID=2742605 RepID=UPI00186959A9|nr:hypothetical protein [Brachybacterium sp. FME24]